VGGKTSLFTVGQFLKAVDGVLFDENVCSACFTSVTIDSRDAVDNSLFFALPGAKNDGHDFIQNAVERGASLVTVMHSSRPCFDTVYAQLTERGIPVVLTDNTLWALQKAAAFYVSKFPRLHKIGVTGSSGKTTVKECIAAVLSQKYATVMNEGNLNSETGLPLSVFKINETHEAAVFEMGMNRRGEIKELADVLFPQTAVITNIGCAHIGILGTKDAIAEEKKCIFSNFTKECTGFIPADDPYKDFLMRGVPGTMCTFCIGGKSELKNVRSLGIRGSEFEYRGVKIRFALCGMHNVQNAAAAISVAAHFGLSAELIKAGLETVRPLAGRMQVLDGDITIVHDSYNANPDSVHAAIDFFDSVQIDGHKALVLGDMGELGDKSGSSHTDIVQRALSSSASFLVFAGSAFCSAYSACTGVRDKKVLCTADTGDTALKAAAQNLYTLLHTGDFVLIKASRSTALERFIPVLRCSEKEAS